MITFRDNIIFFIFSIIFLAISYYALFKYYEYKDANPPKKEYADLSPLFTWVIPLIILKLLQLIYEFILSLNNLSKTSTQF